MTDRLPATQRTAKTENLRLPAGAARRYPSELGPAPVQSSILALARHVRTGGRPVDDQLRSVVQDA